MEEVYPRSGDRVIARDRDHLGGRRLLRLLAEGLVDLDQHLLLPLGQLRVGEQGRPDTGVARAVLENACLHVKRLGRDAQSLGDLLQDVG